MKNVFALLLMLALAFCIAGCGTTTPAQTPEALTISAAASLTDALNKIVADYAAVAPTVKITVNYGASGALQTQIENGAPADIFFSAASKQMEALNDAGLMMSDSIVKLLKNEIVLVIPADSKLPIDAFEDVATNTVNKIAIGDVASVPAGQYAQETFTALTLWDKISAKVVFGSDVRQILSWVSAGEVDCGVVYSTDAESDDTVKVAASAPTDAHKAIVYPVGIVKASVQQAAAADFIKYLQSDEGLAVFTTYGFLAG